MREVAIAPGSCARVRTLGLAARSVPGARTGTAICAVRGWEVMSLAHSPLRAALGLVLLGAAALPTWAAAASVTAVPLPVPATVALAPGVTYQRMVLGGGETVHVLRVSPLGLATLDPIAVSGVTGTRGDLSAATRAATPAGAVASVNGDFFNFLQAYPSSLTITRNQGLISTPNPLRSSLLIAPDGVLALQRAVLSGSWEPIGPDGAQLALPGSISGINRPAVHASEFILFNSGYGATIAPLPAHMPVGATGPPPTGEVSATITPDQPGSLEPNSVITGTVIANSTSRSVRIPTSDLVLTGVGPAGASIATRLATGTRISLITRIAGIAPGTLAIGGGPALVVNGHPVHAASEGFTGIQLIPRSERTAIGQTAAGTDLLVTAEGPGEGSPGITVPQQADLMARLGARIATAMDSGGSSQMIVNGTDVMPWATPRAISTAVFVRYSGVRVTSLSTPISPNNDGVSDRVGIPLVVPSPGTLVVTLTSSHHRSITLLDRVVPVMPIHVSIDPIQLGLPDDSYHLNASLTPLLGVVSNDHQLVVIDRTLGDLHIRPFLRKGHPEEQIDFRLARSAAVTIRVTTRAGRVLRVIRSPHEFSPGHHTIIWNQRIGRAIVTGGANIVVEAATRFGRHGLVASVVLLRPRRPAH